MKIVLAKPHRTLKMILRHWRPKRITLTYSPRAYAWLWWNICVYSKKRAYKLL